MNGQANMGFEPELKAVSMKEIQVEVASEKCPEKAEPQEDVQTVSEDMDNVAGSVAWLAVAGDAAHKAADGLAIGAAFASDLTLGFSTALAVFCHEVPHEMGDIAIMLSAGWSVPKVAILQLATTLAAFAGLFIGIPLSSNEEARSWIFLIAAGMFLYVALSNVMPEMVRTYKHYRSTAILVAANVGFVLGIMIMFIIAIFEEYISI
ncbi:hypothetical protein CAPTEDRAFT_175972 [Capitella teleta]|uniref:Uncharacterized protein n=1 Tax=Capitella teleta TaxID=283909 RepID=R7VBS5_CAPTE|nr:hypothetical protein CAPTEDRAFT_175972 [Capitella teleta]|eukprot:ELU13140.1 hypothetical protein CAPTEDRAFT_175972 [Capitella teleta]